LGYRFIKIYLYFINKIEKVNFKLIAKCVIKELDAILEQPVYTIDYSSSYTHRLSRMFVGGHRH